MERLRALTETIDLERMRPLVQQLLMDPAQGRLTFLADTFGTKPFSLSTLAVSPGRSWTALWNAEIQEYGLAEATPTPASAATPTEAPEEPMEQDEPEAAGQVRFAAFSYAKKKWANGIGALT